MTYRDHALAWERVAQTEREIRHAAFLASIAAEGRAEHRHGRVRELSAAGIRRVGQAVIALSDRIDSCAARVEAKNHAEVAFR